MGGVFSKKKPESRITQHDEAVLVNIFVVWINIICCCNLQQLKAQRDKLRQMRRRIEKNLEREKQLAKQLIADGRKE
jgi:charged multivesicular body protein 6